MEATAIRVEATTIRVEAIAVRVEAIAIRVEAIAIRVEAMAIRVKVIAILRGSRRQIYERTAKEKSKERFKGLQEAEPTICLLQSKFFDAPFIQGSQLKGFLSCQLVSYV